MLRKQKVQQEVLRTNSRFTPSAASDDHKPTGIVEDELQTHGAALKGRHRGQIAYFPNVTLMAVNGAFGCYF